MTKLDIKDIEKKTGKQVRHNTISVGFDTAPAFSGICILKSDTKNINVEYSQVIATSAKDDHFHRADHYTDSLEKFKQALEKYSGHKIMVIEKCFYSCNAQVLIQLAEFGILTYDRLKKCFDAHFHYGATTARAIIKFNQKRQIANGTLKAKIISRGKNKGKAKKISCKDLVHNYLDTEFGLIFDSPDEADAFVLALAGLLS